MLVTVSDTSVQRMLSSRQPRGALYGRLADDGDVAQIQGLTPASGAPLGHWVFSEDLSLPAELDPSEPASEGVVLLLVSDLPQPHVAAYQGISGQWRTLPCMLVHLRADYGARLQGLFEVSALADKRVAVIGLGSGGSLVASYLARCGVGFMRLVDFDRLETQNITRHACGIPDIGRYKTRAVRDLLCATSPLIAVETFEADILAEPNLLRAVISDCDLVVAATDSDSSKLAINRVCWPRRIPAVYGAAYNRAFGGDVFRALPPAGACYDCFHRVVAEFFGAPPPDKDDLAPGYADPQRMADLIAQPGLAMDVGIIAMIMARICLNTLLDRDSPSVGAQPENWVLFGNRAEWIFERPLESLFVDVPKQPACPTCNYDTYVRSALAMSPEEARHAASELLDTIPDHEALAQLRTSKEQP